MIKHSACTFSALLHAGFHREPVLNSTICGMMSANYEKQLNTVGDDFRDVIWSERDDA